MKLRVITGAMLPGLLFGACLAANAADRTAPAAPQETQDVVVSGMKVAIDAKTGHIRPITEAESKHLSDMTLKSGRARPAAVRSLRGAPVPPRTMAESVSAVRLKADGSKIFEVPESMMTEMQVTLDTNGKPHYTESADGAGQQPITVNSQEATQ